MCPDMTETETPPTEAETRCGYFAIIGAPNAGKSTLLNRLAGTKLAIVTPKVQTTRARIIGIAMSGPVQLIFVDTPGIFSPKRRLDRAMVRAAWTGADDADEIVVLVDPLRGRGGEPDDDTLTIVERLKSSKRRAVLALNKVDAVPRESLLKLAARLDSEGVFERIFMISGKTGSGVDDVVAWLAARAPVGPWLYPEDQAGEIPERQLAAEIVREKAFLKLHDELPYEATVETEKWEERKDGSVRIEATIYVRRDGQKAIVLGKGGLQIKAIGGSARVELEALLERRVHLFLFVKVRENWLDDPERYREMGLEWGK